jgi:3,4-dihydroxy-9,10-secoandrosta-1,3,5(10)-triene-9,17-dione 4,5-dioxygenase
VQFEDPFGQPLELFSYQNSDHRYWNPPRPHAGFVTGGQGLGHAVFATPDIRTHVDFYIDAMGFATSDIVKLAAPLGEMWFLRANPRHHSVAFVEVPYSLGLHHVDDLERRSPRFINFREGKRGDMWGHKFRMQPNEAVHPYAR